MVNIHVYRIPMILVELSTETSNLIQIFFYYIITFFFFREMRRPSNFSKGIEIQDGRHLCMGQAIN